ncbi:MAG: ClcB-like voltage-gated chloride channel protein [Verrucomicrobiia bacterium]
MRPELVSPEFQTRQVSRGFIIVTVVDAWPQTFQQFVRAGRGFVREHWQRFLRIREKIRISEETFHLILAGVVGIIGGLTNLAFYFCNRALVSLSFGRHGDLVDVAYILPNWHRVLVPGLGGLAAGLVLYWGLRLVRRQGSQNILEVVVAGDGRLRMRTGLVKTISSLLSISSGASIGREGSIIQLAATLASKGGQLANWQPYRLRLLVACGAASGMAAAYHAPVAGAVFAAQIVLGNFSMSLFAPLVFASVVATMVSRSFFGLEAWYEAPYVEFKHLSQLTWFVVLGILAGGLGAGFLKMLRYSEDLFERLSWPIFSRLALSGLMVGAMAIQFPEVFGNGYSVANEILHNRFELVFLLGIFCAKLLATLVTVGSGTVGGVMTPTLFLGAALGAALGQVLQSFNLAQGIPVEAFALVGMGSVLSATVHSPLLALIMITEISSNYSMMPPLMLACALATLVARRLHPDSIYTEPLRKKGVTIDRESQRLGEATSQTVGDLMREPVPPLRETASFREIVDRFLTSPNNFLPVVDRDQKLLGMVALQDMKEYLNAGLELSGVIAYDVMRPPPQCLTPNQRLIDALPVLLTSENRNIPVVNNLAESRLLGSVARAEALGLLSEAIASGKKRAD